jgi:hypothetical protein
MPIIEIVFQATIHALVFLVVVFAGYAGGYSALEVRYMYMDTHMPKKKDYMRHALCRRLSVIHILASIIVGTLFIMPGYILYSYGIYAGWVVFIVIHSYMVLEAMIKKIN